MEVKYTISLYEILKELNIEYTEIEHEAVFTVEQALNVKSKIDGIGCKNIFLTDRKGNYILVVLEEQKKADIKEIAKILHTSHLSFCKNEELKDILKLEQGSVTPLGIINDTKNKVLLLFDKDLKNQKLLLHPNTNSKTISIQYVDLIKFIKHQNHNFILI